MSKKFRIIKRTRDAITGRFVPDGTEKRRPKTTVRESIKIPPRRSEVVIKLKILLTLLFVFSGCSTVEKSVFAGMGAGVATGAVGSALIFPSSRKKAAFYGGLSMGLVGAAFGYFSYQALKKRDKRIRKETLFNLDQYEVSRPFEKKGKWPYYNLGEDKEVFIITDDPKLLRRLR